MNLVGVSEAAAQLGVHPSQIRRNIKSGLIPNRGLPGRPLVDVDEARYARAKGLDHSKQRGPRAPLFASNGHVSVNGADNQDASPHDEGETGTYQDFRSRREAAMAAKAEIELAQLRGELLDRREVADAQFKLGRMLRDGLEMRRPALAQRLMGLVGLELGAVMTILADADEAHLTAVADELGKRADAEGEGL